MTKHADYYTMVCILSIAGTTFHFTWMSIHTTLLLIEVQQVIETQVYKWFSNLVS